MKSKREPEIGDKIIIGNRGKVIWEVIGFTDRQDFGGNSWVRVKSKKGAYRIERIGFWDVRYANPIDIAKMRIKNES